MKRTAGTQKTKKQGSGSSSANDSLGPIDLRGYEEEKRAAKKNGTIQKPIVVDINETIRINVHWPLRIADESGIFRTSSFQLCENSWCLSLSCIAFDDEEYLSVHLINLSNEEVYASYSFTIFNPQNPRYTHFWTDPEGFIPFSRMIDQNNEWGNPEFLLLSKIPSFLANNQFTIEVEITMQTQNSDVANQSLHEEIEKISTEKDLITLANNDIIPLIKKLPATRNLREQSKQEDRIVRSFK
jgi:predicted house-cleaning noncanonical NTP pyrophosphatase (MazG superfamily)